MPYTLGHASSYKAGQQRWWTTQAQTDIEDIASQAARDNSAPRLGVAGGFAGCAASQEFARPHAPSFRNANLGNVTPANINHTTRRTTVLDDRGWRRGRAIADAGTHKGRRRSRHPPTTGHNPRNANNGAHDDGGDDCCGPGAERAACGRSDRWRSCRCSQGDADKPGKSPGNWTTDGDRHGMWATGGRLETSWLANTNKCLARTTVSQKKIRSRARRLVRRTSKFVFFEIPSLPRGPDLRSCVKLSDGAAEDAHDQNGSRNPAAQNSTNEHLSPSVKI